MLKFIIIGLPRTGSTLLQTTLAQHPNILTHGELFHWVQTEREGAHAIETPTGKRYFDPETEEPIAFLDEVVWGRAGGDTKAAGFKLFAEHVQAESTRDLFAKLKASYPDLSVIYIDRRNMLDVLMSRRMAQQTGQWVQGADDPRVLSEETLNIPVEDVQEFFDSHLEGRARLDRWVEGMRCLRIEYEDLSRNFSNVSKDVFEFLGVEPLDVRPSIVKQSNRGPQEVLENWHQLRSHFHGTNYEHLFAHEAAPNPEAAAPTASVPRSAASRSTPTSSERQMPELSIPPLNYDDRLARDPNIFRSTFGALSDDEWLGVLQRSVHEAEISGVPFPRFPDSDMQARIHGSADEEAIEEAFRFFLFVKARLGERYLRPSARFLDFGSGWGRMLRPYMRYFDLSNIYGFEPNRMFLTVARSLNPHVTFLAGEYMPNQRIPRRNFDLIIGYSIFSHLAHTSTTVWLREVSELLKPGGVAAFTTWGERFIDQLVYAKAQLDAGEQIHWYHQFVLDKVGDPDALREHYQAGKFVWIQSLNDANYGETFLSKAALERILSEHALPLEVVTFDTTSLPQDAFLLRRI